MNIKSVFTKRNLLSFLLCIYMLLIFFVAYTGNTSLRILSYLIILLAGGIFLINNQIIRYKRYIQISFIIFLFVFITQIIKFKNPAISLLILFNSILALILLKAKLNQHFFLLNYLIICCFFLSYIYEGNNPNTFLFSGSRNVVTIIIFFNLILFHYVEFSNKRRFSITPSILFLIVSICAIGRAGIISSIIYFFVVLFVNFYKISIGKKILILLFSIFLSIFCINKYSKELEFVYNYNFRRLSTEGVNYNDDPRGEMLERYISNIDISTFILGYDFTTDPFFRPYDNNPHNSFIRLYSYIGIFSLFIIMWIIKNMFFLFRNNLVFFCISLLICLRAWLDTILFWGGYDFLLITFLLSSFNKNKRKNEEIA